VGAYPKITGLRNEIPQSYTYATYYPPLHYNQAKLISTAATSGMAGRADTAAEFLLLHHGTGPAVGYPGEMANPGVCWLVWELSQKRLTSRFRNGLGADSQEIAWPLARRDHSRAHRQALLRLAEIPHLGGFQRQQRLIALSPNKDFDEFARGRLPCLRRF